MTRYARSGSTQKHQKMPGTATPWSELVEQVEKSPNKKKGIFRKKKKSDNFSNVQETLTAKKDQNENKSFLQQNSPSKRNKKKFAKQKKNKSTSAVNNDIDSSSKPDSSSQMNKKTAEYTGKEKKLNECSSGHYNIDATSSKGKFFQTKKEKYMEKLMKKRAAQNILLLPSKVERKIYNIKRRLREKNLPPALIKEVIRKERRKEELKFRKTFNPSKPCFNCRRLGHVFADCPEKLNPGSSKQETGICFKCGSTEHKSFKCPKKIQGFPFSQCFICKEQGHISRDCPSNTHGVYIKGGQCNLCGNVNHLRKDCPTLKPKKKEESFTLHTMNEATSIDEEILDEKPAKKLKLSKNPKMVKF